MMQNVKNGITTDEYLTTAELSQRIKMAPGTIRNLVWRNQLQKGVHYIKPTPRKLLFVWSEIQVWLSNDHLLKNNHNPKRLGNLINI